MNSTCTEIYSKCACSKDGVTVLGKEEVKGSHLHSYASGLTRHFSFQYDSADVDKIKKMMEDEEGEFVVII